MASIIKCKHFLPVNTCQECIKIVPNFICEHKFKHVECLFCAEILRQFSASTTPPLSSSPPPGFQPRQSLAGESGTDCVGNTSGNVNINNISDSNLETSLEEHNIVMQTDSGRTTPVHMLGTIDLSQIEIPVKKPKEKNNNKKAKKADSDPQKKATKRLGKTVFQQDAIPNLSVSNKFDILNQESSENGQSQAVPVEPLKDIKPPPFFLPNFNNIKNLEVLLESLEITGYSMKMEGSNKLKLDCATVPEFRKLQAKFKELGVKYHTFQLAADKPFKVVIKGLHPSFSDDEVKTELISCGFEVRNVNRGKKNISKDPTQKELVPTTNIFVELEKTENIKSIYNIIGLFNMRVTVEPTKPSKFIIQCKRCQLYGHSSGSCNYPPRCVKCNILPHHATRDCKKTVKEASCVLCNGKHPANFKGCPTFLKIQKNYDKVQQQNLSRIRSNEAQPPQGSVKNPSVASKAQTAVNPKNDDHTYSADNFPNLPPSKGKKKKKKANKESPPPKNNAWDAPLGSPKSNNQNSENNSEMFNFFLQLMNQQQERFEKFISEQNQRIDAQNEKIEKLFSLLLSKLP